jgi:hypothetical protein
MAENGSCDSSLKLGMHATLLSILDNSEVFVSRLKQGHKLSYVELGGKQTEMLVADVTPALV